MAVIKCKMCGGDLVLVEGQSVAECEYCGSRQTVPSADNEKKLNLFARANRLRAACDFDKAAGIYESIVADFPEEAEAYWGLVLCKYGIEYVDDPATGKKIPTCHRSSFESVMDDDNFDQAQENADALASRVYREEAKQIEEIRKGIIAVSSNEKPYDIFICYKETDSSGDRTLDSVLAQDVYDALTAKGYRTFFARITLEDKLGQEYEPYIFAALNSAKIMLAVGTCYEHYNAVWVKNEWSRYLKLMTTDKSKHLIPCYKGLDAYDMPKEFARLQAQDLGKMGAIQDILRGVEKLLPRQMDAAVIPEKVIIGGAGGNNKIASLLDRGNMALEDGDWAKADSFFEDVLNNDSKNAQAYLGKTLAQERCRTVDALVRKRKDVYLIVQPEKLYIQEKTAHIGEMAERYSLPGYVEQGTIRDLYRFDLGYTSEVSGREKQYREEESWWQNHRWLSRAEKFAFGAVAETIRNEKKHLFAQLNDRVKKAQEADARSIAKLEAAYDAHIAEADDKAEQIHHDGMDRREKDYQGWLEQAKRETDPNQLNKLAECFSTLGDYKDSRDLIEHCSKRAVEEQAKIDAENQRQCLIAEQRKKEQEKRNKRFGIISLICLVVIVALIWLMTGVIIPGNNYKKAEALLANGQYEDAAAMFKMYDGYKDSAERVVAIYYANAEALLQDGQTKKAAIAFGKAGQYQDAKERSFGLWESFAVRETIETCANHAVGLKTDGTVVNAGVNDKEYDTSDWTDIVAISTGDEHTVGLKADGTVIATQYAGKGKYTFNHTNKVSDWTDIVAISAGGQHTVGLKANGTVVAVGSNTFGQCDVIRWHDIVAISTGKYHTIGLKTDGTVVAAGSNSYGVCDVSQWSDIVAISAGYECTIGLKSDGTVVTTKQHYDLSEWTDIVAISAGNKHIVGLKVDGTVVAHTESYNNDDMCDVSDWADIVAISAGDDYTIGLKRDGTVVAAGKNRYSQCDVSGWTDIKLPAGSEERKAAMDAAEAEMLAAEYAAAEAMLAEGNAAEAAAMFESLGTYKDSAERLLEAYYAYAEAMLAEGNVAEAAMAFYTLGDYQDARERSLKLWDTVAVRETLGAGIRHTVSLKADGTVVATNFTGSNFLNEGQGEVDDWKDMIAISAGRYHTVGLKADGTVVTTNQNAVASWKDIVAISAGYQYTVGLKANGTVVAAGWDEDDGSMSDWTDIVAISAGGSHVVGLKVDGTVVAVGTNEDGECNVSGWNDIVAVSAGSSHTVGLKADGTVVATGNSGKGQCNVTEWKDIVAVSAGSTHTVGLKADGSVVSTPYISGGAYFDQGQRDVSQWRGIVAISASEMHTVGLRKDGTAVATRHTGQASFNYGQCDVSGWRNIKLP